MDAAAQILEAVGQLSKDLRADLGALSTKIDEVRSDLVDVDRSQAVIVAWKAQQEATTADYERRLRVLEGDRHRIWGMAIVLGAVAGWLAKFLH